MKARATRLTLLSLLLLSATVLSRPTAVDAHGGDTAFVHACVVPSSGTVHIIGANDSCKPAEVPLDWRSAAAPKEIFRVTAHGTIAVGEFKNISATCPVDSAFLSNSVDASVVPFPTNVPTSIGGVAVVRGVAPADVGFAVEADNTSGTGPITVDISILCAQAQE